MRHALMATLPILAFFASGADSGCGGAEEHACGDAGCRPAVELRLGPEAASNVTVRGTADGEPFDCSSGPCTAGPETGAVRLTSRDGSLELVFFDRVDVIELEFLEEGMPVAAARVEPEYGDPYYPNGLECGPSCRSAVEVVTWVPR